MRKTHLRFVVDEELGVAQTACGLRISSKRPVTEYADDVTCSECKQIILSFEAHLKDKAEKRKAKKNG